MWLSMCIDLKCSYFLPSLTVTCKSISSVWYKDPPHTHVFSPFSFFSYPLQPSMQSSEGGSDTTTSVAALRTSSSAQAPVVQPVPASQQVGHYLYPAATVITGQMGKVCNDLTVPSCFLPNVKYERLVILETKPATRYTSACAWCLKRNGTIS